MRERDRVIAHGFYGVYCNAFFLSCRPDYKIGKLSEDVFKYYYTVATDNKLFFAV